MSFVSAAVRRIVLLKVRQSTLSEMLCPVEPGRDVDDAGGEEVMECVMVSVLLFLVGSVSCL